MTALVSNVLYVVQEDGSEQLATSIEFPRLQAGSQPKAFYFVDFGLAKI
jgi:hypothetical protein